MAHDSDGPVIIIIIGSDPPPGSGGRSAQASMGLADHLEAAARQLRAEMDGAEHDNAYRVMETRTKTGHRK